MKSIYNKIFITACMLTVCGTTMAQQLNSAYYTEDYKYRHEMNPAYGNEQNYVAIPALGNINVGLHGNFGYQDVIMPNPMYGVDGNDKKMTTFMNPYISASDALDGFNSGNNRIVGDVSLTLLSAGFKAFGGYNTISLSSKTSFGTSMPYELFAFAKNTGNQTYNIGDINVGAKSYVELALGHSRQINDKLRLGAKLKFLVGVASADFQFKNVTVNLASNEKWIISGTATADVSMKGFTYKSEKDQYNDPEKGEYDKITSADVDGAGIGGFGMAIDLGGVYKINEDWTVNAAVLDLGFINWSNDMQAVNRADRFEFNGFRDLSVSSDHGTTIDDQIDNYGDQITDFINLKDNGDQGSRTTSIGATINVGAEYNLPVYRKITFGALSSTRINGSYSWTEGRLSANWTPLNWLDGGVSFAVNSFTTSMGWILNIHPKGYNFYIGMDHILGKTSKEFIPLTSNASLSVGMSIAW